MRFLALSTVLIALVGCVAAPAPEANGFNVQLYFDGAPLGSSTPVDQPATVTVRRLEQRTDQCQGSSSCDPTSETPITLLSASCDSTCEVVAIPNHEGSVTLQAKATKAGVATLSVRVRSEVDGAEWDDSYPLSFGSTK